MFLDHTGPIVFDGNSFLQNVAYKGVIQISQVTGPIVISGNNFTDNAALVNSNVLSIQMGATSYTNATALALESSAPTCGGIVISANQFRNNGGCAQTAGIASLQCLKPANWVYSDELSVYAFPELTRMAGVQVSSSGVLTVENESYQANQGYVNIAGNDIRNNHAGVQRSIIHVEGFPWVVFSTNYIAENENYLPNSFRDCCRVYEQQTDKGTPAALTEIGEVLDRAKTIVYVRGAETVSFTGDTFRANSVIDEFTPHGSLAGQV